MKTIQTSRLILEPMTEADKELMFQLDQDPEVMKFITKGRLTTMQEIEEKYIPRLQSYSFHEKGWGMWKVYVSEGRKFIGWVLSRPMNFFNEERDDQDLELGWRFKRESWGKGYATEAAKGLVEALKSADLCQKISALALEDNHASINIMKKLGMSFVKKDLCIDPIGNFECVYYSMDLA